MDPVSHFDIPVNDPTKAKLFYETIFGWKIAAVPDMNYWMISTAPGDDQGRPKKPGSINGGLGRRSDGGMEQPYLTVTVKDIDATLKSVSEHGGKTLTPKMMMGEMGSMARIRDPDGNLIGLYQPA